MPNIIQQLLGESATQLSPEAMTQLDEAFTRRVEDLSAQRLNEAETRHASERAQLIESHTVQLNEQAVTIRAQMADKIDQYLTESVIQWANENAPAIDSRLKTEAAETILVNLSTVLTEAGININPDQKQIVESLNEKLAETEAREQTALSELQTLRESESKLRSEQVVVQICEGLAMTQVDRVRNLVEGIEFKDAVSYGERVRTFRKLVEGEDNPDKDNDGKDKDKGGKGKDNDGKDKGGKGENEKTQLEEAVARQIQGYSSYLKG